MLFPGAGYISAFIAAVMILAICVVLAFFMGWLAFEVSKLLIERTKAWKILASGAKDANKWWFNCSGWAGSTMLVSFVIFVYTAAGPVSALVKWLREA
jgi:hypothetical protein